MNRNQDRSAQHAPSAIEYCRILNIFRHKLAPDLYCAVPEDCPVPNFLNAENWRFEEHASETAYALLEVDAAAVASLRQTGCYLFRSPVALDCVHQGRSGETAADPACFPAGAPTAEAEFFIDCFA